MSNTIVIRIAAVLCASILTPGAAIAGQQNESLISRLLGNPVTLVGLFANVAPCSNTELREKGANGDLLGAFVVPQDRVLVITDLLVAVNLVPAPGITRGGLVNQAITGASNPYFSVDFTKQGSQTIHLTTGVPWTEAPRAVNACDSANSVFLHAYGYLAKK